MYGVLRSEGTSERAIFVIDKSGIIRYVDVHDIDSQPDNDVLMQVLTEVNGGIISAPGQSKAPLQPEVKPASDEELLAEVSLYCTPWCPECRKARAFLREKGIDYVEIDVSRDREAAKRLRGWTGGFETTPTFNIRGEIIINFDRERLEKILDR